MTLSLGLVWAATQPTVQIALMCGLGAWTARKGLLTSEGRRVLSGAAYFVFHPALIFVCVAPTIHSLGVNWWPIIVNIMVTTLLGLALGYTQLPLIRPPHWFRNHVVLCTALGNVVTLPLVIVVTLSTSSAASLYGMDPLKASTVGVAYVSLGLLVTTFIHAVLGFYMLKPVPTDTLDDPWEVVSTSLDTTLDTTDGTEEVSSRNVNGVPGPQPDQELSAQLHTTPSHLQHSLRQQQAEAQDRPLLASTASSNNLGSLAAAGSHQQHHQQQQRQVGQQQQQGNKEEEEDAPLLPRPGGTPGVSAHTSLPGVVVATSTRADEAIPASPFDTTQAARAAGALGPGVRQAGDPTAGAWAQVQQQQPLHHHHVLEVRGQGQGLLQAPGLEHSVVALLQPPVPSSSPGYPEPQPLAAHEPAQGSVASVDGLNEGDVVAVRPRAPPGVVAPVQSSNTLPAQPDGTTSTTTAPGAPSSSTGTSEQTHPAATPTATHDPATTPTPAHDPATTPTATPGASSPGISSSFTTPTRGTSGAPARFALSRLRVPGRALGDGDGDDAGDNGDGDANGIARGVSFRAGLVEQPSLARGLSWGARLLSFRRLPSIRGPHEPWHAHLALSQLRGNRRGGQEDEEQSREMHDGMAWAPCVEHPGLGSSPRGGGDTANSPRSPAGAGLRRRLLSMSSSMSRVAARSFSRLDQLVSKVPRRLARTESVRRTVRVGKFVLQEAIAPPVLSCIIAVVVGCITPLKDAIFPGPDGKLPPLNLIADVLGTLAGCCVPCMMLVLGATLAFGAGTHEVPMKTVASVAVCRLVLMPFLGSLVVMGALRANWFVPPDPIFLLVLLIHSMCPTAINVQTMASVHQNGDKEVSFLLWWQYLFAVVTIPLCMTCFLYVIAQQH